jgi:hypothetical protein
MSITSLDLSEDDLKNLQKDAEDTKFDAEILF